MPLRPQTELRSAGHCRLNFFREDSLKDTEHDPNPACEFFSEPISGAELDSSIARWRGFGVRVGRELGVASESAAASAI